MFTGGRAIKLSVKVIPGSSRDCIAEWLGDTLKVRVSAPPEKGKANEAVIKVLAAALDVPVKSIHIVHGTTSARKVVEVDGFSKSEMNRRLSNVKS